MSRKPNILFLLTDDQRFDALRAAGNPHIHTPNMDRLVARGVTFTHACIPGGTVGAVCMPSRAMIHSGRTLFHIEGAGEQIPAPHVTLGEAFRAAGYHAFGCGKWHNGPASFHRSFNDGGEIVFGGMADHWNVPVYNFDPTGRYDKRCLYVENPSFSNETRRRICDHIHPGRHSTDIVTETGLRFLERRPADRPFFLFLSYLAPHDPRTMPREFLDAYDPAALPLPPNFMERHPFDNGHLHARDEKLAPLPRTPEVVRRHLADYYAMISHLDDRIGQVLGALETSGLAENTIIILAGDNGLALGQHGLMGKQNLYDHALRVPLVFSGPGVPRGASSATLAHLSDIFPTLCDLAAVPVPPGVDGKSLVPAMGDPTVAVREAAYLAFRDVQRGVRTARYKLIEYVVGGRRTVTQLFDLADDPWEQQNLADVPAHRGTLAELRAELMRLRDESGDLATPWGRGFWSAWR